MGKNVLGDLNVATECVDVLLQPSKLRANASIKLVKKLECRERHVTGLWFALVGLSVRMAVAAVLQDRLLNVMSVNLLLNSVSDHWSVATIIYFSFIFMYLQWLQDKLVIIFECVLVALTVPTVFVPALLIRSWKTTSVLLGINLVGFGFGKSTQTHKPFFFSVYPNNKCSSETICLGNSLCLNSICSCIAGQVVVNNECKPEIITGRPFLRYLFERLLVF